VFVPVHGFVASHCDGPGVDQAERGLITVHDIPPLRGIPVLVFSGKGQPLLPHGRGQYWFLGGPMGGQPQLFLQAILDGAHRNISPLCDPIFSWGADLNGFYSMNELCSLLSWVVDVSLGSPAGPSKQQYACPLRARYGPILQRSPSLLFWLLPNTLFKFFLQEKTALL
jgi:hypothetical protein